MNDDDVFDPNFVLDNLEDDLTPSTLGRLRTHKCIKIFKLNLPSLMISCNFLGTVVFV